MVAWRLLRVGMMAKLSTAIFLLVDKVQGSNRKCCGYRTQPSPRREKHIFTAFRFEHYRQ
jgi:hypothetical protein